MKSEDYEKTKKELVTEYNENVDKINNNYHKIWALSNSQSSKKIESTLEHSALPYIAQIILLVIASQSGGLVAITNIVPALWIPAVMLGSSLAIGELIRKFTYKKAKIKENLDKFSSSKTDIEFLEEKTKYEIEVEKLKNRNLGIDLVLDDLESTKIFLTLFSKKYNINSKDEELTKEEIKDRLEEIYKILGDHYKELDILSTKKVLNNKFWKVRSKFQRIFDIFPYFAMGGVMTMLVYLAPLLLLSVTFDYSTVTSFFEILAPFVLGGLVTAGQVAKTTSEQVKVFNKINDSLKENAYLPEYRKDFADEENEIADLVSRKVNDIRKTMNELQEQKRVLDNINSKENEEKEQVDTKDRKLSTLDTEEYEKSSIITPESTEEIIDTEHQENKLIRRRTPNNRM